jgi:hypothetical protein
MICDRIVSVVNATKKGEVSTPTEDLVGSSVEQGDGDHKGLLTVEEKDIISASDAKKSTGYLEQLGYSLKKLVWAS